ncbi:hypothetical protein Q4561_01105 [Alteromonas sp. 1_MG-2023]|uniref:hypothetical protein n=1 Tax=Alteromonas sp. 1_MG-2023 TaxID=3062669 RepID=UPI0026E2CCC0|nr:hypothetical protein [Alteromonas sp. 1_MG-2023]MDO6565644.1 hypothetical protein [Alteromonas sp. 1_MG-2023]
MLSKRGLFAICISLLAYTNLTFADSDNTLLAIQQQWAAVNYHYESKDQEEAFIKLIEEAEAFAAVSNNSAEALTWLAITQSSAAKAKGGLGALDFAKAARANLEKAIDADESVLEGTALTVLAALYHNVPGWPVAFGSDKKAAGLFKKALTLFPNSMDTHYFYAEYLFDDGEYEEAAKHLKLAKDAPEKLNRPIADKGRRAEIEKLEAKVASKL